MAETLRERGFEVERAAIEFTDARYAKRFARFPLRHACTLPPNADHVKIMRALVKLTLGHTLATTLADDIAQSCKVLADKGRLHEHDRARVKTGTGY